MKDLNELADDYGVNRFLDKFKSQNFGPNDSVIASSLMHPREAMNRAGDWLQEREDILMHPEFYPEQIIASAGLDLAGLAQTGGIPFAPASAGGTLGTAIKPAKNLNADLLRKYLDTGNLNYDELAKYEKNASKMENTGRQYLNVQNAQANPNYEAYKSEFNLPFYHGTERLDRLLSKEGLDPRRATSGPMPYGTDSPEIASSYAKGKKDTSMMDDDYDISQAFTVSPKDLGMRGSTPYTLEQSWHYLDPEKRQEILSKAPRVGLSNYDQWEGDLMLHPEGVDPNNRSHFEYLLKYHRNNPIKALRDYWLDSGNLFGEEEKMAQIYRLAGYPHPISQEYAPWTEAKGVLSGLSNISSPLDTMNLEEIQIGRAHV